MVLGGIFVWGFGFGEFGGLCHFERSEKSTEFKICLKALKSRFEFMDTSLSCESSV